MAEYDENEHERREKMTSPDANFEGDRPEYDGSVELEGGETVDELLSAFEENKSD